MEIRDYIHLFFGILQFLDGKLIILYFNHHSYRSTNNFHYVKLFEFDVKNLIVLQNIFKQIQLVY